MRKTIIAIAALAAIGMTQMPTGAFAAPRNGGTMSGTHSSVSPVHASGFQSGAGRFQSGAGIRSARVGNNVTFQNRTFVNNRFAFRHHFRHHHRFFRNRFAFSSFAFVGDDDCFVLRRVWTHWGWRLRRIWVCD